MIRVLVVLGVALLMIAASGCTSAQVTSTPGAVSTMESSPTPMVDGYPVATATVDDLGAARAAVVSSQRHSRIRASDLIGDFRRRRLAVTADDWFAKYGAKPYKQLVLHRDFRGSYELYVVWQASRESTWSVVLVSGATGIYNYSDR